MESYFQRDKDEMKKPEWMGLSTPVFTGSSENILWIPGLGNRDAATRFSTRPITTHEWRPGSARQLFFSYVVTEDETHFGNAANLVGVGTRPAKGSARRIAAGVSPGNVAAKE